jgi:hypothetical protein
MDAPSDGATDNNRRPFHKMIPPFSVISKPPAQVLKFESHDRFLRYSFDDLIDLYRKMTIHENREKSLQRDKINPLEPLYRILLENPFHKSPRSCGNRIRKARNLERLI